MPPPVRVPPVRARLAPPTCWARPGSASSNAVNKQRLVATLKVRIIMGLLGYYFRGLSAAATQSVRAETRITIGGGLLVHVLPTPIFQRAGLILVVTVGLGVISLEHVANHLLNLGDVSVFKRVDINLLLLCRVGVELSDDIRDSGHQITGGADDDGGSSLVRDRKDTSLFCIARTFISALVCGVPAECPPERSAAKAKSVLLIIGLANVREQFRENFRDFDRVRIYEAENPQLSNVSGIDVDLLHEFVDARHDIFGGADDQRIGSFVGHGSHFTILGRAASASTASATTSISATARSTTTTTGSAKWESTTATAKSIEKRASVALLVIALGRLEQIFDR